MIPFVVVCASMFLVGAITLFVLAWRDVASPPRSSHPVSRRDFCKHNHPSRHCRH